MRRMEINHHAFTDTTGPACHDADVHDPDEDLFDAFRARAAHMVVPKHKQALLTIGGTVEGDTRSASQGYGASNGWGTASATATAAGFHTANTAATHDTYSYAGHSRGVEVLCLDESLCGGEGSETEVDADAVPVADDGTAVAACRVPTAPRLCPKPSPMLDISDAEVLPCPEHDPWTSRNEESPSMRCVSLSRGGALAACYPAPCCANAVPAPTATAALYGDADVVDSPLSSVLSCGRPSDGDGDGPLRSLPHFSLRAGDGEWRRSAALAYAPPPSSTPSTMAELSTSDATVADTMSVVAQAAHLPLDHIDVSAVSGGRARGLSDGHTRLVDSGDASNPLPADAHQNISGLVDSMTIRPAHYPDEPHAEWNDDSSGQGPVVLHRGGVPVGLLLPDTNALILEDRPPARRAPPVPLAADALRTFLHGLADSPHGARSDPFPFTAGHCQSLG